MEHFKIFLVEDDPWFGEVLVHHLSLNPDFEVKLFKTAKECLSNLYLKPDMISIDFGLPDMKGDQLLRKIQEANSSIPVVITSAQEDVATAVNFLKQGAIDYIVKNENTKDLLWNSIQKIRETQDLRKEVEDLKEQLEQKFNFEKSIIGQSEPLKKVFKLVEKAVTSNINVSITGETGTGKEVIAKAIHFNSDRKKKPFVAVNMAAIPSELIESELFGHEKGAFTGAQNRKVGKFEEADGGTLFLDEIAELDLNLQSKILRALQEREIIRVGGNAKIKFNARLITATHRNLPEEVARGKFREDLFFRIIGLPIDLPPLRNRGSDVLIPAKYFADEFAKSNKMKPLTFTNEAKNKLKKYNFPGNVRELKAVIDLACILGNGKEISHEDITFNYIQNNDQFVNNEKTLKGYNNEIIAYYLKKYNNNVVEVARILYVGKSTIYNLIQKKEVNID